MDANTYGGGHNLKKNIGKQLLQPFVHYIVHDMGGWEQTLNSVKYNSVESVESAESESESGKSAESESVEFAESVTMMTTWLGVTPDSNFHTTNNGRTYLQPQLNKAMRKEHVQEKGKLFLFVSLLINYLYLYCQLFKSYI